MLLLRRWPLLLLPSAALLAAAALLLLLLLLLLRLLLLLSYAVWTAEAPGREETLLPFMLVYTSLGTPWGVPRIGSHLAASVRTSARSGSLKPAGDVDGA